MTQHILILPGDGVGPEITQQALHVLEALKAHHGFDFEAEEAPVGGIAVDETGDPLPEATLNKAKAVDAVLLGAVGGPRWDTQPRDKRPETGLLQLRAGLGLFANLRPAFLYPELLNASTLKPEVVDGLDLMIVRELTGGLYFGKPRGIEKNGQGQRAGFNTMSYDEEEIARAVRVGFETAMERGKRLRSEERRVGKECRAGWARY